MPIRSQPARVATTSAGAPTRVRAYGKDDPFFLRSIPPRTYNAFHALYKALHAAAEGDAIAMEREEDRRQVGDDPEVLTIRMKQFRKAAEIVNALRVALESGPKVPLVRPLRWARRITGVNPPVDPKRLLAPQKDFLLQEVTRSMLMHALRVEPELGEDAQPKDVAHRFAEWALAKRVGPLDATGKRPRGPIEDLAWSIALLPLDGRVQPALDGLRRGPIQSRADAVAEALINLSSIAWEDPMLILEHCFRAMGLPEDEAHSFFSYLKKRAKRGKGGEQ